MPDRIKDANKGVNRLAAVTLDDDRASSSHA